MYSAKNIVDSKQVVYTTLKWKKDIELPPPSYFEVKIKEFTPTNQQQQLQFVGVGVVPVASLGSGQIPGWFPHSFGMTQRRIH